MIYHMKMENTTFSFMDYWWRNNLIAEMEMESNFAIQIAKIIEIASINS